MLVCIKISCCCCCCCCAPGSRPTGAAVHMGHVTARSCRQSRPGAFPLLSSRNRCSGTASGTEPAPEQACATAVPCSGTCVPSACLLRSTRAYCPWALPPGHLSCFQNDIRNFITPPKSQKGAPQRPEMAQICAKKANFS